MRVVFKCQFNRQHRTEAEAETCPGCLKTLPPNTRQRRNAVVVPRFPGGSNDNHIPADDASSTLWETISNGISTPQIDHTPYPENISRVYPSPLYTHHNSPANPGEIAGSSGTPWTSPFTARPEFSDPSHAHLGFFQQLAADVLRKLRTPAPFQHDPNENDIITPPSSSHHLMAPRKLRNRAATPATVLVPDTPLGGYADDAADVLPSIEDDVDNAQTRSQELAHVRTLNFDLTEQLRDSTALVERLRTREEIANIERNHAYEERDVARAETEAVRAERDDQWGGKMAALVKFRAVAMIVFLYVVYRWVLYGPEFEYVLRRTKEEFGLADGE